MPLGIKYFLDKNISSSALICVKTLRSLVTINVLSVESKHKGKYVFKRHRNPISYKVGIQEEPIKTKSILYFIFLFQI